MIGFKKSVQEPVDLTQKVDNVEVITTPIESLSGVVKEPISYLGNISLKFNKVELDYLVILSWLKENMGQSGVVPYIAVDSAYNSIDSSVNKVVNILTGKRFNGTLELEKTEVPSDIPTRAKVEVQLL